MKMQHIHNQHGFTLIEALVAIVVLAIGMLGSSRLTVSTITMHTANERLANASALIQDRMERLKESGYAGSTTVSSTEAYGTIPQYSAYKRVTSVAVNTPEANMKTVTVTISWQKDQHTLNASTILAE
jgi:prepilin-type N-terminal cleavage/methylation domain-containing protein